MEDAKARGPLSFCAAPMSAISCDDADGCARRRTELTRVIERGSRASGHEHARGERRCRVQVGARERERAVLTFRGRRRGCRESSDAVRPVAPYVAWTRWSGRTVGLASLQLAPLASVYLLEWERTPPRILSQRIYIVSRVLSAARASPEGRIRQLGFDDSKFPTLSVVVATR